MSDKSISEAGGPLVDTQLVSASLYYLVWLRSLVKNPVCQIMTALMMLIAVNTSQADSNLPTRIVSVGGSITEIIYTLGAQHRIVGVDTSSLWPLAARSLPQVGYQRNLSAEGVLSLMPDLVIVTTDAGPPSVIEQIRSVGIEVAVLENTATLTGITEKIRRVALLLDSIPKGRQLIDKTSREMNVLNDSLSSVVKQPTVLFLLSVGRGAPLASGAQTAADGMIKLAGGANAMSVFNGFKPLSVESLIAAAPDFILTTQRTFNSLGGLSKVLEIPGIAQTPAGINKNIITMDGLYLLGLGPRSPRAATDLAKILHPQINFVQNAVQ